MHCYVSLAKLLAGEPIQAYTGLSCLDSEFSMNFKWNPHHKFAAIDIVVN
jgi:hypothetical protein